MIGRNLDRMIGLVLGIGTLLLPSCLSILMRLRVPEGYDWVLALAFYGVILFGFPLAMLLDGGCQK